MTLSRSCGMVWCLLSGWLSMVILVSSQHSTEKQSQHSAEKESQHSTEKDIDPAATSSCDSENYDRSTCSNTQRKNPCEKHYGSGELHCVLGGLSLDEVWVTKKQNKIKQKNKTKTKQNKTKRNKTKQNETKRNKTKQNEAKRNKTKQNPQVKEVGVVTEQDPSLLMLLFQPVSHFETVLHKLY